MNFCGIIKNDIAAAPGISTTLFVSGCPHHCPGCHNPETWDFNYGKKWTVDDEFKLIKALQENNIVRNFCIMGGEPLAPQNREQVMMIIMAVKSAIPNLKIYLWTGYTYEELIQEFETWSDVDLRYILNHIDFLIDGRFIYKEKDLTLDMRGSRNQRIIELKNGEIISIIK